MSRLDAALAYAEKGWAVLPLRGKLPAIGKSDGGRGVHDASTDMETITAWWTKWPNSNIGVACGQASGFFTLDIDPRHNGDDTLAELEKLHGALPTTVEQFTGGGGRHILFKFNGDAIRNRVNCLGTGLDVRATGGYIVVEPSCHPETKQPYAWNVDAHPDEVEIADAPLWLLERVIDKPKEPTPKAPQADPFLAFGQRVSNGGAYAEVALKQEAEAVEAAAPGQQENTLNTAALKIGSLVGAGALEYDNALDTLTEAGLCMTNAPDREPWTREQIVAKVERGLKDGMAKPRQVNTDRSKERKAQKGDSADRYAGGIRTALDLDQIEPPAYNVPGVLQENTTAVFWSPPGQLKTAHVVDLWARQSLGSIWREHALPPGLSLMIPLEDIAGFGARGRFWQEHHGLQLDARALWWQAPFDFSKECTAAVQEGIERAQDQHKLPLRSMFLDPILAAFGEGSASDDADFRRVLDSVNSLLENFKTATGVIVTHTSWEARHEFGSMVQRALTATSVKFTVENEVSTLKLVRQKNDREGLEFHFKLVTGEEPGQVTVEALDQDEAATLRMPKRARLKKQGRSFWNALIYVWDSAQAADALHVPDNPEIAHSSKCAGGVRLGEVRVRFEALYGFESTANAQQKRARWSEGKNEVEVAGLCGFWKELVWPIFK